ncbi:MAG TPA: thioredoxin domain-containing protein [Myxococcota bacterium]|nr:thioredoxin domain-containing protein [Myxococcota bacterium]
MAKMRFVAAAGLLVLACGNPSQKQLQAIQDKQDEILTKLNAIQDRLPRQAAGEEYDKVYTIAVGDSPVRGDPDGKVTIVEFSDFQCPYCAGAAPIITQVLQKYPKGVRFVYKQFPLPMHSTARPAAVWSLAAQEQGKFWEMHDVLIQNQRTLDPSKGEELAKQAGLDVKRFKADLEKNGAAYAKRIDADIALGSTVDVRGTPTIFIGGKKVKPGGRSVEGMGAMIDAELAKPSAS